MPSPAAGVPHLGHLNTGTRTHSPRPQRGRSTVQWPWVLSIAVVPWTYQTYIASWYRSLN